MVAINSDENVSRWCDNAIQQFNKKLGNKVKKKSLPVTQLIEKLKQEKFHITSLQNYWEKHEVHETEVGNIRADYIATSDTLYEYIADWGEKLQQTQQISKQIKKNQKNEKEASAHLKNLL